MLRALLAALVVANLAFWAFASGSLDGVLGWGALGDREPERLAQQVRPESIRLLPMGATASAPVDPSRSTCFETPAFGAADAPAVEAALTAGLPAGTWTDTRGERPAGNRTEATHTYRVGNADAALAAKLLALKLDLSGSGFSPCAKGDRPR
ncbi:MAG: hypothetical protein ABI364_09680 [Caldimonas sp.]